MIAFNSLYLLKEIRLGLMHLINALPEGITKAAVSWLSTVRTSANFQLRLKPSHQRSSAAPCLGSFKPGLRYRGLREFTRWNQRRTVNVDHGSNVRKWPSGMLSQRRTEAACGGLCVGLQAVLGRIMYPVTEYRIGYMPKNVICNVFHYLTLLNLGIVFL